MFFDAIFYEVAFQRYLENSGRTWCTRQEWAGTYSGWQAEINLPHFQDGTNRTTFPGEMA